MARVKRAVHGKKHRRAVLEQAQGYYGNKSRSFRAANEQVMHSLQYAYRDRRARKGDFRQLWIQRINAAARQHGMSYSRFIAGLKPGRGRGRPQGAGRPGRHRSGRLRRPGGGGGAVGGGKAQAPRRATATGDASGRELSFRHQRVQRLRRLLRAHSARQAERAFVLEGEKLLAEAVSAGVPVESIYLAPGGSVPEPLLGAAARVFDLAPGVMERVADTVTPQPVMAVVPHVDVALDALAGSSFVVVCVDLRDPGNAGTVLRSAEAAGADGVIFCVGAVDVYNPKTVRASAGSLFHVPVVAGGEPVGVLEALSRQGLRTLGAVPRGGTDYAAADLTARSPSWWATRRTGCRQLSTRSSTTASRCRWPVGPNRSTRAWPRPSSASKRPASAAPAPVGIGRQRRERRPAARCRAAHRRQPFDRRGEHGRGRVDRLRA